MSGMTEQLGRVLGGRYRLTAPVGTGSSAQVFLADDVTLRRRVAVKVLHPALAADESFLRRFRAEARSAAALSHPNLMAVYDWGEDDVPYLVLEFLGGGSLRSMLDAGTRLTPSQAVVVGLDAARALDAAHRRSFVHRDIKPANLLFGDDARLRIADFGLARALSEAAWTEPGDGLIGTARYAAPEQAASPRIDGKADVYSLGLVLIEAVTGQVPLTADTALGTLMRRVDEAVPVPPAMGPLRAILERAGRVDPGARPDASELARGLLAAANDLDRPTPLRLAGTVLPTSAPMQDPTLLPGSVVGPQVVDLRDGGAGDARTALFDDLAADEAHAAPASTGRTMAGDAGASVARDVDVAEPKRRRRRWPWVALVLVLLAAGAAGATTLLPDVVDQAPEVRAASVPNLSNLSRADAEAALAEVAAAETESGVDPEAAIDPDAPPPPPFTWAISVRQEPSEATEAGFVIRQVPDAGTELAEGETVRFWVSLGPPLRVVPDLVNRTPEEVQVDLEAAELAVGTTSDQPDEVVDAGRVLTWRVGGEDRPARIPKGTEVDVVYSSGPAPRVIPSLAGASLDQARADLAEDGLDVTVTEQFSNSVAAGVVIATNPGGGATVARGDTVELVVSKGPDLVTVPDVSGLSEADAIAALEAAGLVAGSSTGPAGGSVFETDPGAGASVQRGTEVDLFRRR